MRNIIMLFIVTFSLVACASAPSGDTQKDKKQLDNLSTAYFASGCFWCVEAVFESVKGVEEAVSGYSGGTSKDPNYQEVSAGLTDHAEAVKVYYDSTVVDFATLVKVYYGSHDPTTVNRQGPDRGRQYRSIAFYKNEKERVIIEGYIAELFKSGKYKSVVTEVVPFDIFYRAEDYHQDYERRNPDNPYVRNVSIPRLNAFKRQYPELLK